MIQLSSSLVVVATKVVAALLSTVLPAVAMQANDETRLPQWHLDFLDIERAHEISTGEGVVVGLIDRGVDGQHPDLVGRVLPGKDFSSAGLPDALTDQDGHGTAMAGLIAANGRTLGIAPDATILPARTILFDDDEAIDWAVASGATVLCLAFSTSDVAGVRQPNPRLRAAIERAIANDVVVVAAVGNTPGRGVHYPAGFPGVVAAAGVDENGNHADVSVVSRASVLAAPAVGITAPRSRWVAPEGYGVSTGTSDATAIIAGVAALIRSKFPELTAEEVVHRMTYTADDRGSPGWDEMYGYGVVNPVAALTVDVPGLVAPSASSAPAAESPVRSSLASRALVAAVTGLGVLVVGGQMILSRRRRRRGEASRP